MEIKYLQLSLKIKKNRQFLNLFEYGISEATAKFGTLLLEQ